MEHQIRLERLESRPLAVVRRRASQPEISKVVVDSCGTVWNALKSAKLTGAGRNIAVYLDGQINLEVGVEFEGSFPGAGEVVGSATPAGLVATTTHLGPYGLLGDAHKAILKWCRENGQTLAGPSWEIYGHWQNEWINDPSQIRTDIYYLIAEANDGP